MAAEIVTPSVLEEKLNTEGLRPAAERLQEGEVVPFSEVEKQYKNPVALSFMLYLAPILLIFGLGVFMLVPLASCL